MNIFSWKKGVFICLVLCFFGASGTARADIIELQPFEFGEWAITNNTGPKYITVNTNGSFTHSPELININHTPQHGIYRVDNLPPSTAISSVNVSMIDPLQGGSEILTMDNFQVIFTPTNASGEMTITLGATARTTGNSQPYDDATYNGTLQLDINY